MRFIINWKTENATITGSAAVAPEQEEAGEHALAEQPAELAE